MSFFHKDELKILWPFYLEGVIGTILFIQLPFAVLYFNSINFSAAQIGFLLAIPYLASLLFEIPTGAVADIYGRKFSVILGWFLEGITTILCYFTTDYNMFLLLFALGGISMTFVSGSYEAWVVDLMRAKRRKGMIKNYFSKKQANYNLAFVISGVLGAFLVKQFGLSIIWIFSGLSFMISGFLLYFGEEVYERHKLHIKESFKRVVKQTKDSISFGYNHHALYYFFLIATLMAVTFSLQGFISLTPLLTGLGFTSDGFGYLWSVMAIVGIIAPLIPHWFRNIDEKKTLIAITFGSIVCMILFQFAWTLIFAISIILIWSFLLDMHAPLRDTYFHRFVPTRMRATMGSVRGMMSSIGAIIGLPLAGFLIDKIGPRLTLLASGGVMVLIIILYLMIKSDKRG